MMSAIEQCCSSQDLAGIQGLAAIIRNLVAGPGLQLAANGAPRDKGAEWIVVIVAVGLGLGRRIGFWHRVGLFDARYRILGAVIIRHVRIGERARKLVTKVVEIFRGVDLRALFGVHRRGSAGKRQRHFSSPARPCGTELGFGASPERFRILLLEVVFLKLTDRPQFRLDRHHNLAELIGFAGLPRLVARRLLAQAALLDFRFDVLDGPVQLKRRRPVR